MKTRSAHLACVMFCSCLTSGAAPPVPGSAQSAFTLPLRMVPSPIVLDVAQPPIGTNDAAVTGIGVLDFNNDGIPDIAVAWYHSNFSDFSTRARMLTIFTGDGGGGFSRLIDINLYIFDPALEARSVFRNGTGTIAIGDFDGDGDQDIAVLPYFGDEMWFIENLPGDAFAAHLRFPFGSNSFASFITPPKAGVADFDGDGRADLVYVSDVSQRIDPAVLHFWRTSSSLSNIMRVDWEGVGDPAPLRYTRSLAVGDFDNDGRPDVVISGTLGTGGPPVIALWKQLDLVSQTFIQQEFSPGFLIADLATMPRAGLRDRLIGTDLSFASTLKQWTPRLVQGTLQLDVTDTYENLSGHAPGRGAALAIADLTADGTLDVVARQRCGSYFDTQQIQVVRTGVDFGEFVATPPFTSTAGIIDDCTNEVLRPLNVAAADLFGSPRPEIIAAFRPPADPGSPPTLKLLIWRNGCIGDINGDGVVNMIDLVAFMAASGCVGDPGYNPAADLNRDGCIDLADLLLLFENFGCMVMMN